VLEKVAESLGGRVLLVKVNVDEHQAVAGQLGVRGIPAVMLFRDGRPVDGFVGARPESFVREFLQRHLPAEAAGPLEEAEEALRRGDLERAKALLEKAEGETEKLALLRAEVAFASGEIDTAWEELRRVDEHGPLGPRRRALAGRIHFSRACPEGTPGNEEQSDSLDGLFQRANCLAARGEYRPALELFLQVLSQDKNYRDGAAKEAMLRVFDIVGRRSPLADEYRDRLATLLY